MRSVLILLLCCEGVSAETVEPQGVSLLALKVTPAKIAVGPVEAVEEQLGLPQEVANAARAPNSTVHSNATSHYTSRIAAAENGTECRECAEAEEDLLAVFRTARQGHILAQEQAVALAEARTGQTVAGTEFSSLRQAYTALQNSLEQRSMPPYNATATEFTDLINQAQELQALALRVTQAENDMTGNQTVMDLAQQAYDEAASAALLADEEVTEKEEAKEVACASLGLPAPIEPTSPPPATTSSPVPPAVSAYIVSDQSNHRIQQCPATGSGDCTTVAGGQGSGQGAQQFNRPLGITLAPNGDIIVADFANHRIQRCPPTGGGDCTTVAGGKGAGGGAQQLNMPTGVTLAPDGDIIVSDTWNHRIQRCPAAGIGDCTTVMPKEAQCSYPRTITFAPDGDMLVPCTGSDEIQRCPAVGGGDCIAISQGWGLDGPERIAIAPEGDIIVVDGGSNRILRCPAAGGGDCTTLVGGQGAGAGAQQLQDPRGIVLAPDGDIIIADMVNHRIQRCPTAGSGDCSTVAGGQGAGSGAQQLNAPWDFALRFGV